MEDQPSHGGWISWVGHGEGVKEVRAGGCAEPFLRSFLSGLPMI